MPRLISQTMEQKTPNIDRAIAMYKAIKGEYDFKDSIFRTDSTEMSTLKWIIQYRLTDADKVIIKIYAETQSVRETARLLGMKRATIHNEIRRIQDKIKREYYDLLKTFYDNAGSHIHR